ncbi:hypothetical protein [Dysgonomonas sp. 520]|uniref:hypothetical protein n=1 Tax=Dysgonomonas sp. 520 TaxID=2302931 RepID=UPI0013D53A3B|nr:hypothetical protein [Dysgonomonas sp. 520]NDW10341.1 hypothetical protein [Dysgonomonas sp. 520]
MGHYYNATVSISFSSEKWGHKWQGYSEISVENLDGFIGKHSLFGDVLFKTSKPYEESKNLTAQLQHLQMATIYYL